MEFEDAKAEDAESIARVARESLSASYGDFVDEGTIDEMVDQWYAAEEIERRVADEASTFMVVKDGDDLVGFVQGASIEGKPVVGEIHWLHVTPDARGEGIGVQLLGRAQEELEERGADVIRGLVLVDNESGAAFYEDHGFDRGDEREVEIQGETFTEAVYEKEVGDGTEGQVVESMEGPDGEEMYVNFSEAERGTIAPFYAVYSDGDLTDLYSYRCGNCGALATAMDSAGRITCDQCENARPATRWDASYL